MRQYRVVDVVEVPEKNYLEKKLMEDVPGIVQTTIYNLHFISQSKSKEETVGVNSYFSKVSTTKEIRTSQKGFDITEHACDTQSNGLLLGNMALEFSMVRI